MLPWRATDSVAGCAALSCAVTYPLGVVGVILAIVFIRKVFVRPSDMPEPDGSPDSAFGNGG